MLKLTVDPEPGYAVKELFFTYNEAKNNLYAIFPKYPDNGKLTLRNIVLPAGTKISFLSTQAKVDWKQDDEDVEITLPAFNPNTFNSPHAFALKIENYGRFAAKPQLKVSYKPGELKPTVTLTSDPGTEIRFTDDGTDPGPNSIIYNGPVVVGKNSLVKAYAFYGSSQPVALPSAVVAEEVKIYQWMNGVKRQGIKNGISYKYYQPETSIDMSSISNKPDETGVAEIISLKNKKRKDRFAFEFSGFVKVDRDGIYSFFLESDDGSQLLIDGQEVINNGGYHGTVEKAGRAALKKGYHKIQVLYFDAGGDNSLRVSIQPEGGAKQQIPPSMLYH
jgi:hypothetical protein